VPFLRFARDKRGIETTALLHASRRQGTGHPRLLYWFRTPPNVRVGRAAIDEEAIRRLEEGHPEVTFDWPRILHASAHAATTGAAPPRDEPRARPQHASSRANRRGSARPVVIEQNAPAPVVDESAVEPEARTASAAAAGLVGHDDLSRLRARYSELLTRISEKVSDPQRAEALRLQAEALNPDGWVTPAEVARGLETFGALEQRIRDLLGSRRRTRRGGSRRRKPQTAPTGSPASEPPQ
jgi:hypothetical protein